MKPWSIEIKSRNGKRDQAENQRLKIKRPFKPTITNEMMAESTESHRGATKAPMRWRWAVKITSGTIAKGNCRLNTTWLSTKSAVAPASPCVIAIHAAGMTAKSLVASRRTTGGRRRPKKPSITIWPARVAVTVAFNPQAIRATANNIGANRLPMRGSSSACASESSATSVWPEA